MTARRLVRPLALAAGALVATLALAGCVGGQPEPTRTAKPSASASGSAKPELRVDGTAKQNLAYFDSVNEALIAKGGDLGGRAFVDNLVAAGFVKADMELTPDTTSVGLKADSIQFSVKFNGDCLLGQYGVVGYVSQVVDQLGTGRCLVGKTRPIDW